MTEHYTLADWHLTSNGMRQSPTLPLILAGVAAENPSGYIGWGARPSGQGARRRASRRGTGVRFLEDGFIRSWGTGDRYPTLSLVLDDRGIYYDSTRASWLEHHLNSRQDLLAGREQRVQQLMERIRDLGLSKYNHAPRGLPDRLRPQDRKRVLVVDQTAGDLSLRLGGGLTQAHFHQLYRLAQRENPNATLYIKTHPEVTGGRKKGHFAGIQENAYTVKLTELCNPADLLQCMDRVYVGTSQLGFDALLQGKPVTCMGQPWYAGWGLTTDRMPIGRRTARRSLAELFAAAYLDYTGYLNPFTHAPGELDNVIDYLALQQQQSPWRLGHRRTQVIGFPRWRRRRFASRLSQNPASLHWVKTPAAAATHWQAGDQWLTWGTAEADTGRARAEQLGADWVQLEDGFLRSVGLGSDLIPPRSLVFDDQGIYFDPSRPSRLEHLLNTRDYTPAETRRAAALRQSIIQNRLTKYNLDRPATDEAATKPTKTTKNEATDPEQPENGSFVSVRGFRGQNILVIGQVEDDASIRHGCTDIRTNLGLLETARQDHPQAHITYRPHPDVQAGNRKGRPDADQVSALADRVTTRTPLLDLIEQTDAVYTLTSLVGFDALLRGKPVSVFGRPFYAGWGLTDDRTEQRRRHRTRTLDELVAASLIDYPSYWDPVLKGVTTPEASLHHLIAERERLHQSGQLSHLAPGGGPLHGLRRQLRKLRASL